MRVRIVFICIIFFFDSILMEWLLLLDNINDNKKKIVLQ